MGVARSGCCTPPSGVRRGRRWPACVAGTVLALTPVAVLMFRFDNPDALLVLLLIGAVACTMRALESTRLLAEGRAGHPVRWLALGGALVGLAFLTKMLQAFLVLPALGARLPVRRAPPGCAGGSATCSSRSRRCSLAGGWWVAVVDAVAGGLDGRTSAARQHNSILELTLGYNGFGRLTGNEAGSVGGGAGGNGGGMWGATGLTRMFGSEVGGQVAWLLPAALVLARRRAVVHPAGAAHRPAPSRPGGVGRLAAGHRPDLQLHGRDLPRLLHGGAGPGRSPRSSGIGAWLLWRRPDLAAPPRPCWRAPSPVTAVFGFVLLAPDAGLPALAAVARPGRRAGRRARAGRLSAGCRRRSRAWSRPRPWSPALAGPTAYAVEHRGDAAHRLDPQRRSGRRRRPRRHAGPVAPAARRHARPVRLPAGDQPRAARRPDAPAGSWRRRAAQRQQSAGRGHRAAAGRTPTRTPGSRPRSAPTPRRATSWPASSR